MFGTPFNHQTIKKYVVAFGSLFNNIVIARTDSSGTEVERLNVGISYSPKQKYLVRLDRTQELKHGVAIVLPRMAFEMTNISYDPTRKLNTTLRKAISSDTIANTKSMFKEVPYNFDFELYIFVKNAEDGTNIVEQILPFFTPEFTVTMNTIPSMNIKADIPIILNSVSYEDSYEGDFETRRAIIWTLGFTMKGYLYPPVKEVKNIRKLDITINNSNDPLQETAITDTSSMIISNTSFTTTRIIVTPTPDDAIIGDDFTFNTSIQHGNY